MLVILPLLLGFVTSRMTDGQRDAYTRLPRPPWAPPGWAFPVVCTALYIGMGVALERVVRAPPSRAKTVAIALFIIQLGLNLVWTPVFWGGNAEMALTILQLLVIFVTATALVMAQIDTVAAALFVPYFTWLCVAHELNRYVVTHRVRTPDEPSSA